MAVILRENFWALAPILFFPFKNNRNPKFPGASHPKMSYFFGASRPKYWGGANSSQGAPIFHCPKWGFIFVQDRAGPQKVSGLFQTIIPPLSHNTPPLFRNKNFRPMAEKKMGVLNELKRSKIRFSAPSAPRKFWDLGVSHNTPPCFATLGNKGGYYGLE